MRSAERSAQGIAAMRPSREDVLDALQGASLAVMLYGSQARGDARPDSDVDVLQVVEHSARSYSINRVNISAYTVTHLHSLAKRGSLFVRHLRIDGVTLSDPTGVLAQVLSEYNEPTSYWSLRENLAVVTAALRLPGADLYPRAASRAAAFTVRSLVYAACAEAGISEFDVLRASAQIGCPQIGIDLRSREPQLVDLLRHAEWLLTRARVGPTSAPGRNFDEAVVWAGVAFPAAGALLEAVLADEAEIDYTALTLPIS